MENTAQTKFESDLQVFFPEIYKLHAYAKCEKFLWDAIYSLLEMRDKDLTGDVNIHYVAGKIDRIYQGVSKTAYGKDKPYLDK